MADSNEEEKGESQESRVDQYRRTSRLVWMLTSALIALSFLVVLVVASLHRSRQEREDDRLEQTQTSESQPRTSRVETEPLAPQVKEALDSTQRLSVELEIALAKQAHGHALTAEAQWYQLYESTLEDATGMRIAGDDIQVAGFIALRDAVGPPSPTGEQLSELASIAGAMAVASERSQLQTQLTAAQAIRDSMMSAYAHYRSKLEMLKQLRAVTNGQAVGNQTLGTMLRTRDQQLASERMRAAESAGENRRAERLLRKRSLESALDHAQELIEDLERNLDRIHNGETIVDASDESGFTTTATREEYEEETKLIRSLLSPFVNPGYVQPNAGGELTQSRTKTPMSLSAMIRAGALRDDKHGLQLLFRIGGSKLPGASNDRPLGAFPRFNSMEQLGNPDIGKRVREARRLLRNYGSFLVEDDLLAE